MTSAKRDTAQDTESLFNEADKCEEMGDLRGAFKRFLTAAELGHAMSQVSLGNFYASGKAVRRDLEKAAHWYKKAYKNGETRGQTGRSPVFFEKLGNRDEAGLPAIG